MSSVSKVDSTLPKAFVIDFKDEGKPRYTAYDQDGDGVADDQTKEGAAAAAATGVGLAVQMALTKAANQQVVAKEGAQELAGRGVMVTRRGISSVDGFTPATRNASAAFDFTGSPTLPDNGPIPTTAYKSALSDFIHRTGGEDAALLWSSLSTMAQSSAKDVKLAGDLSDAMQLGKLEEKKAEIKSTEEQIQAEREAAAMNLMIAVISAMVQMMGSFNPAMAPITQALGQVIKALGEYINKTSGPQAEADDKKIEILAHQMMQEAYEQGAESAKKNYEDAKENMKLALKILTEHAERQTQISSTITRTT